MRWLVLCLVWTGLYLWSDAAGDWVTPFFSAYAASLSLILIIASYPLRQSWAFAFRSLCLVRILFESADAYYYFPDNTYDAIVSVLNMLEFFILFGVGGLMTLRGWYVESGWMLGDTYRRFFNRR